MGGGRAGLIPFAALGEVGIVSKTDLIELSASDARAQIARGAISAVEYTQAFLDRVAAVEKDVQAFRLQGHAAHAAAFPK